MMKMLVFWAIIMCRLVGRYHLFRETYRLNLQTKYCPQNHWYLPTSSHVISTQMTNIFTLCFLSLQPTTSSRVYNMMGTV